MIARLSGILAESSFTSCVVDCGGVGYEVQIPVSTFDKLPQPGNQVVLKIHTAVREDAITLYGFATEEERKLFRLLIEVSGIGGKLALNVLSSTAVTTFCAAVGASDVKALSRINGIGKRTAERGFRAASVYENNKMVDGLGGGICQTSSTLYGAVLYADLEVVERRSHSMTVSYVPKGQDATVVYGGQDFKFRNITLY